MKLSLMTFMCEFPLLMEGEWNQEKSEAVKQLICSVKNAGFTGIDLISTTVRNMGQEAIRQLLSDNALELTSLICVHRLADTSISDADAEKPYLEGIEMASFLDCRHLMLVPGIPFPDEDPASVRETLHRRFSHIIKAAKPSGIECMIEDDPNLNVGLCRQEDVRGMLQAVPGLKLVYDSANMIVAGEDPVVYYEALHEYVIHMHIKDINVCDKNAFHKDHGLDGRDYASAPHCTGLVDFNALFQSFCTHGYDSVLSLEYVPSGKLPVEEELNRLHAYFLSLSCRYFVGVNEVGMIGKLVAGPWENVWKALKKLGAASIEVCAVPDHTEQIRQYTEELSLKYSFGIPKCLARGDDIYSLVDGIKTCGLRVYSCHVMLCEAYPELIAECIPYIRQISHRTGIRQFVISCMFETAAMTKQYLPFIQKAASALKEDGITLCYHNHDMDSSILENGKTALEMVLEECPDCMIQLDIGWAWYGNMDSVVFMQEHGSRIASIHLKDLAADSRERNDDGRFTAIGYGCAPTAQVLDNLHLCNIAPGILIIDQDASGQDIYQDIAAGIQFIRNHGERDIYSATAPFPILQ